MSLWDESLLQRASEVEADAQDADGDVAHARRREAAELRLRAIGTKLYPVSICAGCFRLTGWLGAGELCDSCLRARALRASYADPHGGWVALADDRQAPADSSWHLRRKSREAIWLTRVEPDATGPVEPEVGFELEGAHRSTREAADGSCELICFSAATDRFDGKAWQRLATSRIRGAELPLPAEFSAVLPIEQLAEAWGDFQNGVQWFNAGCWSAERARRQAAGDAREREQELRRRQADAIDLLGHD